MRYAQTDTGPRTEATPLARATCACCNADVLAKCGEIVRWHWAHEANADCDPWAERDSVWHDDWSRRFPEDWTEAVIGPHRADVKRPDGLVVEFQHSAIGPTEIRERENFYGRMIWIFDATDPLSSGRLSIRLPRRGKWPSREIDLGKAASGYRTFRWKFPRSSLAACNRPVFLDLGRDEDGEDNVFSLRKINVEAPCGGWGYLRGRDDFIRRLTVPKAVSA